MTNQDLDTGGADFSNVPDDNLGLGSEALSKFRSASKVCHQIREKLGEGFVPTEVQVLHLDCQIREMIQYALNLYSRNNSTLENPTVFLDHELLSILTQEDSIKLCSPENDPLVRYWKIDTKEPINSFVLIYRELIDNGVREDLAEQQAFLETCYKIFEKEMCVISRIDGEDCLNVREATCRLDNSKMEEWLRNSIIAYLVSCGKVSPDAQSKWDSASHDTVKMALVNEYKQLMNQMSDNFSLSNSKSLDELDHENTQVVFKRFWQNQISLGNDLNPEKGFSEVENKELARSGFRQALIHLRSRDPESVESKSPIEKLNLAIEYWHKQKSDIETRLNDLKNLHAPKAILESTERHLKCANLVLELMHTHSKYLGNFT